MTPIVRRHPWSTPLAVALGLLGGAIELVALWRVRLGGALRLRG